MPKTEAMPPCYGMNEVFLPPLYTAAAHSEAHHARAKEVCDGRPEVKIKPCPFRKACAEQGLKYEDKHSIRCGLRLWVPEERAQLASITE
jgi:hypothetical protein